MKKIKFLGLVILMFIVITFNANAAVYNTPVNSDLSFNQCKNVQDSAIITSGSGYFLHCVRATCFNGEWNQEKLYSDSMVTCSNGNIDKYHYLTKNGCLNYQGSCNSTTLPKYCTQLVYYDCGKTGSGGIYTPPVKPVPPTPNKPVVPIPPKTEIPTKNPTIKTQTKKPTAKKTYTVTPNTTTEAIKSSNNFLSNIELSIGEIEFDKNQDTYVIEINEETKNIDVTVVLEDEKSTYEIENNTEINIEDLKPIIVTVKAENNDIKIYRINLKLPGVKLESNSKLKSLEIENHNIEFDPDVFTYNVKISKETKLVFNLKTDSEKATYTIDGNDNLKNKSKIIIKVTAEDATNSIYTINVKKSSKIPSMLIVIIILALAGYIGYKVFMKLISKKEEAGYEYE